MELLPLTLTLPLLQLLVRVLAVRGAEKLSNRPTRATGSRVGSGAGSGSASGLPFGGETPTA